VCVCVCAEIDEALLMNPNHFNEVDMFAHRDRFLHASRRLNTISPHFLCDWHESSALTWLCVLSLYLASLSSPDWAGGNNRSVTVAGSKGVI
jgi:hypothetical protein